MMDISVPELMQLSTLGLPIYINCSFVMGNGDLLQNCFAKHEKLAVEEPAVGKEQQEVTSPVVPSGEMAPQARVFAHAVDLLMEARDEQGEPIFKFQRHWIGVFRVAVDRGMVAANDYDGFCSMIKTAHPADFKFRLNKTDIKKISDSSCYFKPFADWKFEPYGVETLKPFEQMKKVVTTLNNILNH